jgi:hypothetical protein
MAIQFTAGCPFRSSAETILYRARSFGVNFVERLLRSSALLDLANILKFTAISAMLLERKIRCQNSHNLSGRGIQMNCGKETCQRGALQSLPV